MLRGFVSVLATTFSLAFAACLLGGCASPVRPPERTSDAYQGPTISVDSAGTEHIIVVQAPTGGWDIRLDRLLDGPGYTEAFVTLRKPNPLFVNAQVVVTHRLASKIGTTVPCRILARVKDYDDEDPDTAYSRATDAPAKPAPPPKPAPQPAKSK